MLVTGTGTEVGKTWVGAAALRSLRSEGRTVSARKPAQSFDVDEGPTDAEVLAAASGEAPETVCPPHRWYPVPLAPPMAAAALGRPSFTVADLAGELAWPSGVDVGLVEGAGGPRSPMAADGDLVDLARLVRPDVVVLVADAGLGTINAVRLCLGVLAGEGWPTVVVLNRFDPEVAVHRLNRAWLAEHDGMHAEAGAPGLAARLLG